MTRQEAPDIAICGMSLRLGGGIRTPEEFWSVLSQGRDVQEPVPPDRYNIHGFTDRLGGKNCIKALNGYFINTAELGKLDVSHFQMSKDELAKCDPQQRLLLETTYEALADAGELEYAGAAIGCYVGTSAEDWLRMSAKELQHTQGNVLGGAADFMLPNRVSYQFNLKGPSYAIKTGCSASLLALHAACNDLRNGSTTGAVVGGTSLLLDPTMTALMSSDGIISPTGSCNTFDAKADGFARADGIAVLYIKRVNDAVRDGNPIRAVIKGTGTNTDGRNLDAVAGLMQPNGEAQEALMRQTYSDAGLDPHETRFVELHGTGTPVGDPIEATAVGRVFGSGNVNEVYIGSVKPNVGHTEAASGLVSTIKAVMALEKDLVPPNIKFTDPNPNIPFAKFGLRVPTKETPFPGGRAKRVSVNSFGVGGANAHAILEATRRREPLLKHTGPHILLYSANTLLSLQRNKQQYDSFVQESPVPIADIAYTLGRCREKMPFRAFRVVDDTGEMLVENFNNSKAPPEGPKVVMIFTGQGAQWPRMGVELIETDPRFRADLERMDCILQTLQHAPAWDVISELQRPPESSRVGNALLSQPLCTILQIALFNHFTRAGIKPCAVIGHSSGEIAAAYAAHKLSLEAAIVLAYYRGLTVANAAELASSPGSMAVVSLGSRQLSPYLRTGVVIACENSPASSTISGDKQQVDEAIHLVKKDRPDADCRFLRVDTAYHSHHMLAPGRKYVRVVQQEMIDRNWGSGKSTLSCPPNTRFFSSVTGEHCEASALQDPAYWQKNLVSPVRFATAVANLLKDPELEECLFLEIGPHAALAGPLRQNCVAAGQRCEFVPSLTRGKDSRVSLHSAIGELFLRGVSLDLSFVFPTGKAIGGLPPYAWDHSNTYWYESRLSREWRFRKYPHHCLLGSRLVESSDLEPIWRSMIHIENEPWLSDHRVKDDVVFPLVGYVSMAGEAIRQLTGLDDGYTIKDLVVRTALVLPESSAVEVLTSLRQYKTSDIDYHSEWFTFSICSHNGSSWILHCEGLVKHCNEAERLNKIVRPREHQRLPRTVNESQFYKALSRAGITYGPEFLLLRDVRSATTHCEATGELVRKPNESYNHFVQHPVLMDACFQLVFVSLAKGLGRNLDRTLMPTKIQELYVGRFPEDTSNGPARVASLGSETDASVECMVGNSVVFYIGGAQFSQLGEGTLGSDEPDDGSVDPHAAASLYWLPDAECFDVGSLIQPPRKYERKEVLMLEELTLLCILESADRIRLLEPQMGFMVKYREWLLRDIAAAKRGEHPFLENAVTLATMSPAERRRLLDNVYSCLLKSERTSLPIAVKRICDNIEDITSGEGQVLDVLMHDNELTKLYSHLSFDYGNFVKVLSHWKPTLRILEVGAGTGATTELIVRSLLESRQTKAGLPSYSTYTFTDISAGFFAQAKERFSYAPNMEYKVLDVSRDALSQGFEPASHDIVFAANVLHATPSLANTLTNLRTVLKPGGYIVITELCCLKRCAGYIFGTLPGWWLGQEDGREWEPYVPVSRWNEELKGAGFTGVDTAVYDDEQPFHFSAAIVSRRLDPTPSGVTTRGPVAILSEVPDSALTQNLVEFLRTMGWETMVASTESAGTLRGDADIICLWDLEAEFFENMTERSFNQYKQLIKTMKPRQNLLWAARPVQIGCLDPRSAQGIGAAKAVRAELGLNVCTLEIEPSQECFSEIVEKVFRRIRRDSEEENEKLYADKEFAVIDGVVCTGRYHPFSVNDELAEVTNSASAAGYAQPWDLDDKLLTRKRLDMERPGRLETLRWVQEPIDRALDDNAVEVEPRYVGLNFRDVVIANGLLSLPEESPSLSGFGVECAGVVTRTGQAVRGLSVGDRVMALTAGGCLSTRVVIPALQVCKIPDAVSFEEAATIPACFGTAWKAICDVACVEKGQSVLIHSACGGFGLAAVQICRLFDAEIFATVSSPEKIDHLVHDCGIPRNHIFDSRSNSFLGGVMRETEGRGVDLVLNSLSGDLLHASWKCVAPFGMLVELGKRDIAASGKLDMLPFLQNRSYSCINMAQIVRERPETIQRILCRLVSLFENGKLTPLAPKQVFSPLEMHRVFLHFQQGIHIGKLLIRLEPEDMGFKAAPTYRPVRFKPDAAYLLVGGLGGLGRSIATWLAERGARHLVFLSRCAGLTDVSKQAVRELASMGCHAVTVAGRVDKVEDVKRAIGSAEAPIRGVFQLAMVLKDASMTEMSWSDWHAVVAPKVQGTYNLHNELLHEPLDFFWMASSLVSVIDQTGQGNYGAANTFLEAFSQYRRTLGLPASVLNISPIDGVGYIAENPHARRSVAFQDMGFETEKAFLDTLELSILRSRVDEDESPRLAITANPPKPWADRSQIIMGLRSTVNLNDEAARTNWRFNRRMGFYHNTRPNDNTNDEACLEAGADQTLKNLLSRASRDVSVLDDDLELGFLARHISRKVLDMTLKPADTPVDVSKSTLGQMGVDSLIAVELRRWFRSAYGLHFSALEVMQAGTFMQVGKTVAEKLKEKYSSIPN